MIEELQQLFEIKTSIIKINLFEEKKEGEKNLIHKIDILNNIFSSFKPRNNNQHLSKKSTDSSSSKNISSYLVQYPNICSFSKLILTKNQP